MKCLSAGALDDMEEDRKNAVFNDMFLKRVLHPVGQGAFFTEQFYDESGKVLHNVVYDCGCFTSRCYRAKQRLIKIRRW